MRIAAVYGAGGKEFGLVEGDHFKPLISQGAPVPDLRQVIALISSGAQTLVTGAPSALDTVKFAAPVGPLAKNVVCVGKNYHEHAREFARSGVDQSGDKQETPDFPVVFTKAVTSLADPGQPVDTSLDPTHSVDYEGELGVVIGRPAFRVARDRAYDHVFGYVIVNDVTSRELQRNHGQWTIGKGLDTFCPMGPWLLTADEAGDVATMKLVTEINGEVRQKASVADLVFDIPTLIETMSATMTLHPGDIIATGTPAGVGIGFKPPKYLARGDVMRVSITGLGALENAIE